MTRSGFGALRSVGVGKLNYLLIKGQTFTWSDYVFSNRFAIPADARRSDTALLRSVG
jgi:hypothetical protein